MRDSRLRLADTAGQVYPQFNRTVTLSTKYVKGATYHSEAPQPCLSADGIYKAWLRDHVVSLHRSVEIAVPADHY